ncbi:unnamed protein product [Chrysoparadoxa australica]
MERGEALYLQMLELKRASEAFRLGRYHECEAILSAVGFAGAMEAGNVTEDVRLVLERSMRANIALCKHLQRKVGARQELECCFRDNLDAQAEAKARGKQAYAEDFLVQVTVCLGCILLEEGHVAEADSTLRKCLSSLAEGEDESLTTSLEKALQRATASSGPAPSDIAPRVANLVRLAWLMSLTSLLRGDFMAARAATAPVEKLCSTEYVLWNVLSKVMTGRCSSSNSYGTSEAIADTALATTKFLNSLSLLMEGTDASRLSAQGTLETCMQVDAYFAPSVLCLAQSALIQELKGGSLQLGSGVSELLWELRGVDSRGEEASILLGCALLATGKVEEALREFRGALELHEGSLEAIYGAAQAHRLAGDAQGCRKLLLYVGEHLSSRTSHHQELPGCTLCIPLSSGSGRAGTAEPISRQAIIPATWSNLGWLVAEASMALGDWGVALAALEGLSVVQAVSAGVSRPEAGAAASAAAGATPYFINYCQDEGEPEWLPVQQALVYVLLQLGHYSRALEVVEAALAWCEDPLLLLYRADALLCLEQSHPDVLEAVNRASQMLREECTRSSQQPSSARTKGASRTVSEPPRKKLKLVGAPPPPSPCARGLGVEACRELPALPYAAALNNQALALVMSGKLVEACRLLHAACELLPQTPTQRSSAGGAGGGSDASEGVSQPHFNLTLVLWRLGRMGPACKRWLGLRYGEWPSVGKTRRLLGSAKARSARLQEEGRGRSR